MTYPNFNEEIKLWNRGYKCVVGLDEVGRGPLAGPVVACAVIMNSKLKNKNSKPQLKTKNLLNGIKDSKKLTAKQREGFYGVLTRHPQIKWGIGRVSEKVIDKINIFEATKLAMEKAINNLKAKRAKRQSPFFPIASLGSEKRKIDFLILDGNFTLDLPIAQKAIVRADEKVFSCAAASILAKVTRDRLMLKYDKKYPAYGFRKHKGYPTKLHRERLKEFGFCAIHRKSFKPVKEIQTRKDKTLVRERISGGMV